MPMALTLLREKEKKIGEAWATRVEKLGSAVSFSSLLLFFSFSLNNVRADKAHLGRIESIANANGSHIVEREGEEEKKRRKRNGKLGPPAWKNSVLPFLFLLFFSSSPSLSTM
jgi:hypothetical protein